VRGEGLEWVQTTPLAALLLFSLQRCIRLQRFLQETETLPNNISEQKLGQPCAALKLPRSGCASSFVLRSKQESIVVICSLNSFMQITLAARLGYHPVSRARLKLVSRVVDYIPVGMMHIEMLG
jgi:hypothetical protein